MDSETVPYWRTDWFRRRVSEGRRAALLPFEERFWAKVDKTENCWNWAGSITRRGYGAIRFNGRTCYAHRISYELTKGPIPTGLTLDHLCHNRACVKPDHLDPVTMRENILRGEGLAARESRQTHCLRGHPLSGDNVAPWELRNYRRRVCKTCRRERDRQRVKNAHRDAFTLRVLPAA